MYFAFTTYFDFLIYTNMKEELMQAVKCDTNVLVKIHT